MRTFVPLHINIIISKGNNVDSLIFDNILYSETVYKNHLIIITIVYSIKKRLTP